MNTIPLMRHFERMGVRIKIQPPEAPRRWGVVPTDYSLDVQRDRKGEHYLLSVPSDLEPLLDAEVLQVQPKARHLLLMLRKEGTLDRFLCGHDEREWFVAAVPGAVSTVDAAMESLKPRQVHRAQDMVGLNARERKRRKNRAFRRQGEWFFLPVSGFNPDEKLALRWEPIARSGGKPHMVQFLYRTGGETVYVSLHRPNGISPMEYQRLIKRKPSAKGWNWSQRRINPSVFARGEIRHPDHRTIVLHEWHEVLMNTESQSRTMSNVAFID